MATRLADVHEVFRNWLALPAVKDDPDGSFESIDLALATVVANRLPSDPMWLFLVASPSGGKTEIVQSLNDVSDVHPLSSLTANTFASGLERPGRETSLLARLDGKVMTLKDFTTVLTMYREKRAEILAQLREIFDGAFRKEWGNGKTFDWSGKVGLLAGVTGVIDREISLNSVLGERFLLHRVPQAPARDLARQAIRQRERETEQRRILRRAVAGFLEAIDIDPPPLLPPALVEGLGALAVLVATGRSTVYLDREGEIEYVPEPEGPSRVAKQLATLAQALAIVRQEPEVSARTYVSVVQVGQDSLPKPRQLVLSALLAEQHGATAPPTTTNIAERLRYPTRSTRRYLQELTALRLIDRVPAAKQGLPDRWAASQALIDILGAVKGPEGVSR